MSSVGKGRKPYALEEGSTIAVVAPSFSVESDRLNHIEGQLSSRGINLTRREDIFERFKYFAGTDLRRSEELKEAIRDPSVDGIICARGGYGCTRLLPDLEAQVFNDNKKPLAGYSDITSLLLWQWRHAALVGFHSPMLDRQGGLEDVELDSMISMLMGRKGYEILQGIGLSGTTAVGTLMGGSLTMVVASLGTSWEIDTRGSILLLEEVNEKPYQIDRMLQQLKAAGKFDAIVGVGIGYLVNCIDSKREEPTAQEVIEAAFVPLGVPVVTNLPFGHDSPNRTWPLGIKAEINARTGEVLFLENGVLQK